ncbi:hypothetical protein FJZ28_02390 [Candidatus Peregrinibacteria bacterium]|nr:hypothetical protein [Candidatus Peregrinibacteria bacterium]
MSKELAVPKPVPESPALYTAGLLDASKQMHNVMRCMAASGEEICREHARDFNIPWYLETKTSVDVTLQDYHADIATKLREALLKRGTTERTLRDCNRIITHWAFSLLRYGIALHKKSNAGGGRQFTVNDLLIRTRDTMGILARNRQERPLVVSTPAHPLWNPHKGKIVEMQGVPKCILKGTLEEHALAKSLVGSSINIEHTPEAPMSDIAREAVPELLQPDYSNVMELSLDRRKRIRKMLTGHAVFTDDLRQDVTNEIADMWLEINPRNGEVLDALETELRKDGPAILDGSTINVLNHYIVPLIPVTQENISEMQRRMPIVGATTLRSVLDNNQEDIAYCIHTLEALLFMNEDKYSRTIQVAILACMARMQGVTPSDVAENL